MPAFQPAIMGHRDFQGIGFCRLQRTNLAAVRPANNKSEVTVKIKTARRLLTLAVLGAASPLFVSGLQAQAPEPPKGDLWETVSQMTVEGMPFAMAPRTMKICAAKEWTRPPADESGDRGCVTSEFARDPNNENRVTWTSVCEDGMTGQGEITRDGDDAYVGELRYSSPDGSVVINLSGKRIDECDNPQ
jgi:hypothetical protein